MASSFIKLEQAIEAFAQGSIVIVVDASDRENEGDFLVAADLITAEHVDFMTSIGRGHLCMPITSATADRLALEPLVPTVDMTIPRFAMPLDHKDNSTGISPIDRAYTVRQIINEDSRPEDFLRPGHMFPLIAREGGVLQRPGHTEAAIDLARLAGRAHAGVLCEICSSDGRNMADMRELQAIAERFELPMIAIDTLIEYCREHAVELQSLVTIADICKSVRSVQSDSKAIEYVANSLLPTTGLRVEA